MRWLWQLTEPNVSQRFHHASEALEELEDNEDFSHAIARSQPNKSNIQLQKSPHKLKIKIPRVNLMFRQIAGICLIAICLWFASLAITSGSGSIYSLLLLLLTLVSGLWILLPGLGETIVYFDHQSFEIQWKLFGFCWRRQRGQTLEIDGAFKSEVRSNKEKITPEVILTAGVREYIFRRIDPPLTEVECYWLVEEIKNWLGLKEREIEEREERGNRGEKVKRRNNYWF